jgi:signal transduction histidine kinase
VQDEGDVVRAAGTAAALWFQREQLEAELRMNVLELEASRARLVRAGDEERRRIERDLHDGAQQRLSALLVRTRLERRALGLPEGEIAALLDEVERGLADSLGELRALAAGILPPVLSDFGLAAAIDELAARSPVPVDVDVIAERMPAGIEVAAYFVVAEALANSLKHSHAARVVVRVWRAEGSVLVEIRDDGVGGVNRAGGTGLQGLADRVGALGGALTYGDAPDGGAVLRAVLPCTDAG